MRTRDCDAVVKAGRMTKADGFLAAADEVLTLDDEGSIPDVVVTLLVHAGIAAADVICCARLGKHAHGDDHSEAVGLLEQADKDASNDLAKLLRIKTKAGYSHQAVSSDELKRAERAATRLVERARQV